jgi:hypothetical protein
VHAHAAVASRSARFAMRALTVLGRGRGRSILHSIGLTCSNVE